MADFCRQCAKQWFDDDRGDLKGMCKEGELAPVLCEGCGFILVNHLGECVTDCVQHHGHEPVRELPQ